MLKHGRICTITTCLLAAPGTQLHTHTHNDRLGTGDTTNNKWGTPHPWDWDINRRMEWNMNRNCT